MPDCQHCTELKNGFLEFEGKNCGNRTIYETENFVVIPSLGPLIEGHLMIISKKHYLGFGGIPEEFHTELEQLQNRLRKDISEKYSPPIFFEHGDTKQTGSISHAHLHILPINIDLLEELSHFNHKKINSFKELKEKFNKGESYIYYESVSGDKYLFDIPEILPGGYLRKIISKKLGKPEKWEWKVYPGFEEISRTIKKLRM